MWLRGEVIERQLMTGRHKNRGLNFRPDPDLKERFKAATTQAGTSMAAELTAFVRGRLWIPD